jgi:thiol-disulfide isomerase/thioredoxin
MKKLLIFAIALVPILVWASQRVMVCEDVTATWCTYCPGAARGFEELYWTAYDSVVVIAYHSSGSDPFYNASSAARMSYYGVGGYPTAILDGNYQVVGGVHTGTMYPTYRSYFDLRKSTPSPAEINLTATYDSTARTGTVTAVVRNTSGATITAQLQFALIENHIAYAWQGMDSLQNLLRDMLPDASGEAITVPAGDSVTKTRNFTINASWNHHNCMIVVFVQNNSTKEIYQGAEIAVMPTPNLTFAGFMPQDGNNNLPEPGDTVNLTVYLRNLGNGLVNNVQATLSTADPYLTITYNSATYGDIAKGDLGMTASPYTFIIPDTCPNPYTANFTLDITATGYAKTANFPLIIATNPGLADNIESGQGSWQHSGILDNWHITTHLSHSATHSWYCGHEGSWQYTNENDAKLVSPPFVVGPAARLKFWHYYSTEQDYDFCYVEINNGSGFWSPLASFSGTNYDWTQADYDLSAYAGQTIQVRFRFISDYSNVSDGWYIDDVEFSRSIGIKENTNLKPTGDWLGQFSNPVSRLVKFQYPAEKSLTIKVYDNTGKLVKVLNKKIGENEIVWNLKDGQGRTVQDGVYFVRYEDKTNTSIRKLIVTR